MKTCDHDVHFECREGSVDQVVAVRLTKEFRSTVRVRMLGLVFSQGRSVMLATQGLHDGVV
jgi:hypothetical protein